MAFIHMDDRSIELRLRRKALNGLHWWDCDDPEQESLDAFQAKVARWKGLKPSGIEVFEYTDHHTCTIHNAHFYDPSLMRGILQKHGIRMGVKEFIRLSDRETFAKGTPEQLAIHAAYGPQHLPVTYGPEPGRSRRRSRSR